MARGLLPWLTARRFAIMCILLLLLGGVMTAVTTTRLTAEPSNPTSTEALATTAAEGEIMARADLPSTAVDGAHEVIATTTTTARVRQYRQTSESSTTSYTTTTTETTQTTTETTHTSTETTQTTTETTQTTTETTHTTTETTHTTTETTQTATETTQTATETTQTATETTQTATETTQTATETTQSTTETTQTTTETIQTTTTKIWASATSTSDSALPTTSQWHEAMAAVAHLGATCKNGNRLCGGPGLTYKAVAGGGKTNEYCKENCVKGQASEKCLCVHCMCGAVCPSGSTKVFGVSFEPDAGKANSSNSDNLEEMLENFSDIVQYRTTGGNWSSLAYSTGYNFTRGLEVTYSKGCVGFRCTVRFRSKIEPMLQEAYLAYFVRFPEGFPWQKGGKLAGSLCGGTCPTANGIPTGYDGFTSSYMWRQGGAALNYIYHARQPWTSHGEGESVFADRTFTTGQWHHVLVRVKMNTVGNEDGILETWLDGHKAASRNNLVWRKTAKIAIDQFLFTTFFGGQSRSFSPPKTAKVTFDEYLVCGVS